jgi:hypothetical protein
MLDDLPIVRFVMEAKDRTEVFERGYKMLATKG